MGQDPGTVRTTGQFACTDSNDTYPTHSDLLGKGGFMPVANAAARLAIPTARRREGMLVRQIDTGEFYMLVGGIADINWVLLPMSGTVVLTFWSVLAALVTITATPTDQALPSVAVPTLPTGYSIYRSEAVLSFRKISDDSGSDNQLAGNQNVQVQKAAGTFATCIALLDNMLAVAADSESSGDAFVGSTDIKATVDGDATYGFKITQAVVDGANLYLHDVQTGLRITLVPS